MPRLLWSVLFLLVASDALAQCPPPGLRACDPPYRKIWPKSEYPFALAPNGCDYIGGLFRDPALGLVDFTPACNNHDRCYFTLGASSSRCNDRFLKEMIALCREAHSFPEGETPPQAFLQCRGRAETIAGMVALAAPIAFYNAQKAAHDFDVWIRRHCTLVPAPGCREKKEGDPATSL